MAIVFHNTESEIYVGILKAAATVTPGCAVIADYSAGTAASPATDGAGDGYGVHVVCNYDPYAATDMTDTEDYTVGANEYLLLKQLQTGDAFTTDQIIGTYASIAVDDIFAVNGTAATGTIGKWVAIGVRTPVVRVQVIEKNTLFGNNALKFRVIAA